MMRKVLCSMLLVFLGGFTLTACDQGGKTSATSQPEVKKYKQATMLQGSVNYNSGTIKAGVVHVTDENGRVITQTTLEDGHFQVEVPANTVLPVLLKFTSESGKEEFVTAVIYDTVTRYYINPSTTAIAKAAKSMGGYTRANMDRAAENTVHVPDSNKTSAGWRGDPTKQYGGWH